jgi:hypothetical protein
MLLVVVILTYLMLRRMADVAAVQDSLDRDWEISFNDGMRPVAMPAMLDEAAADFARWYVGPEPDYLFYTQKGNRDVVWHERIRSLFRGRITSIEIYYPGPLRGDLGKAIARFPRLRCLKIHNAEFSDFDWRTLLHGLHRLDHLQELEISDERLINETLEPLAGHPSLRKLTFTQGKLDQVCARHLSRLPRLEEVHFYYDALDNGGEPNEERLAEMKRLITESLPKVRVIFD